MKSLLQKRIIVWLPVAFWLFQLEFFSLRSLWTQTNTTYVMRFFLGLDFMFFPLASSMRRAHMDPYMVGRFVTPPFSIAVGRLGELAGPHATKLMFLLNIVLVLSAVWLMARSFGVGTRSRLLLMGAVGAFYPVQFLVERGNLDGIMLILFALAIAARPVWLRTLFIGLSINVKLYTAVAMLGWAVRRNWKAVVMCCGWTALIVLPFADLIASFLRQVAKRSTVSNFNDNLSPAYLLGSPIETHVSVKVLFVAVWIVTLAIASLRFGKDEETRALAFLTPWMAALPLQVWPYTGVMVLALYCAWLSEPREQAVRPRDVLFVLGLSFIGLQQNAFLDSFAAAMHTDRVIRSITALGTLLLMAGAMAPAGRSDVEAAVDELPSAIPSQALC